MCNNLFLTDRKPRNPQNFSMAFFLLTPEYHYSALLITNKLINKFLQKIRKLISKVSTFNEPIEQFGEEFSDCFIFCVCLILRPYSFFQYMV